MQIGYIFDLDGVLTNTAEYHYRSWKKLAEEEGLPFTRQDNEALRGVPRRRCLEILLSGRLLLEETMQEMMERKNRFYREFLHELSPNSLLPGVPDFLDEAKSAGIRLGLASASKNARYVCDRLEIMQLFDTIGDGYSVVNAKPAPDLFIWVAGGVGIRPQHGIVFEDAEAGIQAALAGGFWTVGIGPGERVGEAHMVRENLTGAHISEFELPLR